MNNKEKSEILLSIYVPTFNRCNKVINQLKFLVSEIEGLKNIELVVNNNASEDDTENQILKYKTEIRDKFTYHCNDKNLGILGNAYKARELTKGKYLWILGDDDKLKSGILARIISILENTEILSLIFINHRVIKNDKIIEKAVYQGADIWLEEGLHYVMEDFYKRSIMMMLTSAIIYKKEVFNKVCSIYDLENEISYGFSYMAALIALKGKGTYFIKDTYIDNDQTEVSWSNIVYKSRNGMIRCYKYLSVCGYSKKEIKFMYHDYIKKVNPVVDLVDQCFLEKKVTPEIFSKYVFLLMKSPGRILYQSLAETITILKNGFQFIVKYFKTKHKKCR